MTTLWYLAGVPARLFSVNVDTDPSRRGGGEKGREAGFPMSDALGIHKRGLSALSSSPSEESVVSLCIQSAHSVLKITENVSFNIASEASYIYILRGQKFIKNADNGQFGDFL